MTVARPPLATQLETQLETQRPPGRLPEAGTDSVMAGTSEKKRLATWAWAESPPRCSSPRDQRRPARTANSQFPPS